MIPGAPEGMDLDGARSARLLFVPEYTTGVVNDSDLVIAQVRAATCVPRVPSRPRRVAQQLRYKLGRLGYERDVVAPLVAAREAVLGERAGGPPRFLVRVDEFPHYRSWDDPGRFGTERFERFHEVLAGAGVPYLLAVLPRVSHEPLSPVGDAGLGGDGGRGGDAGRGGDEPHGGDGGRGGDVTRGGPPRARGGGDRGSRPLEDGERAILARLAGEGVALAQHGLTHRTRHASPRRHSELCGLGLTETAELLDAGLAELAACGVHPRVFVPPYNRFDAAQLEPLAERFQVVCGGPESIGQMGFQRTPQWRGETVYLPSYAPFYGHAAEVRPAVERAIEAGWGLWIPVVLHWGWEAEAGWRDLERLIHVLAPCAADWEDFLAAVERSKESPVGPPAAREHESPAESEREVQG
jgi:hypothetical protein